MDCPNCGGELYSISGLCTDRDGIREDRYCPHCHRRYGTRSHGYILLSKPETPGDCKHKSPCMFYEAEK